MTVGELELVSRLREVEPLRPEAFEQARTVLRAAMAGDGSAGAAPARPRRRPRRRALAIRGMIGLGIGIAAAAVAVVLIPAPAVQPAATPSRPLAGPSAHGRPPAGLPAAAHRTSTPLTRLADYIKAHTGKPAGNATLVIRTEPVAAGRQDTGADLYTDSGAYYWAPTESGLPAQIAAHHDIGDGMFRREVAAALYAVNGNLAIATQRMINAAGSVCSAQCDPHTPGINDNYLWENSLDALTAGAGNPRVRIGVLRLLSTLPEVTVTNTTTGGQPTLTLTAGSPAFPGSYREALTIDASSGVPVAFAGGIPGQKPNVTIAYQVFRVTLAAIAAGKF
jgi:hypothetical protein